MNLLREIPWAINKRNRPEPLAIIPRRRSDVFLHDDGSVSLAYLTRHQAELVREALSHDARNYALHYILSVQLGYEQEVSA